MDWLAAMSTQQEVLPIFINFRSPHIVSPVNAHDLRQTYARSTFIQEGLAATTPPLLAVNHRPLHLAARCVWCVPECGLHGLSW